MHSHIGKNIRLFRIKHNIDLKDVARRTKLTRDALYKIERGELYGKSFVSYVMYLKKRKADLNVIFDLPVDLGFKLRSI